MPFPASVESVYDPDIGGQRQTRDEQARSEAIDHVIGALARRQHGVVGRHQLLDLGLGEKAIDHRLAGGRLYLLHQGVYAVGHRVIPKQGWWMAAVLASSPEAVLSHHSAAALWGLRGCRERIDVTVPRKSTSTKRIRRHFSLLPDDEIALEEEIPVTSVPRTILDLAAIEPVDTLVALLRESEYLRLYDRLSLWRLIERYPRKRGVRNARAALARLKKEPPGRKRSPLEDRFAPFLRLHRLPLPRFNDWIVLGDKRYLVDCHWPDLRQIVELDGWDGHSTRTAFREDRARDRRLAAAGYTVNRITWNELDDEPEAVASDLRSLLATKPPEPTPRVSRA